MKYDIACVDHDCDETIKGTVDEIEGAGWCLLDFGRSGRCPFHGGAAMTRRENQYKRDFSRAGFAKLSRLKCHGKLL